MYILVLLCRNNCEAREVNFKINVSLQNKNNTIIRSSETTTPHTTMFIIHVLGLFSVIAFIFVFYVALLLLCVYQDGECWRFIPSKWYFTVEQLASDCCLHPNEQVSAIAWWEQFRWDDNMMSPLWPTQVDFYSASSLKQQSVRRHVDSESPCVDMSILRVRA